MKVNIGYRSLQYIDLALGVLPVVNTVKSLAIFVFQHDWYRGNLCPNKRDDVRLYFLLKHPLSTMVEGMPLFIGNLMSLVSLVVRVVRELFLGRDLLREDLQEYYGGGVLGAIHEVDYLYVLSVPAMSARDRDYFLCRALINKNIWFLKHLKDNLEGKIDKVTLCRQVLDVARALHDKEDVGEFFAFLQHVRSLFSKELGRDLTFKEQLSMMGHPMDKECLFFLLSKDELTHLQDRDAVLMCENSANSMKELSSSSRRAKKVKDQPLVFYQHEEGVDQEEKVVKITYEYVEKYSHRLEEGEIEYFLTLALVKEDPAFLSFLKDSVGEKVTGKMLVRALFFTGLSLRSPSFFSFLREVGQMFIKIVQRDREVFKAQPLLSFLWLEELHPEEERWIPKRVYELLQIKEGRSCYYPEYRFGVVGEKEEGILVVPSLLAEYQERFG